MNLRVFKKDNEYFVAEFIDDCALFVALNPHKDADEIVVNWCHWRSDNWHKSSRMKTKVGFPPTFVFRPLTPPYMRVRIRRFLICNDTLRSIPRMTDSLLARGFYCSLRLSVSDYLPLPNIPCLHFPTDMHAIVVFHILLDCAHAVSEVSSFSICTCGCACEAIHP